MKCDELTPIDLECNMGPDVNGVVQREPWKAYDIDEVDAAIAELKSENKMLKEHIANGDVSRITWIDEATELKSENEQLKAKLENVQASAYADSVDAGMRERRLRRALWLARANKAESEARGWYHSNAYIIKYDGLHNIKGVLYGKGFKRYPDEWMKLWIKIESLCLKKSEEYK